MTDEAKCVKLTKSQRKILTKCAKHRYVAGRPETTTVLSLERRGLVSWERGSPANYARVDEAVVTITPAGRQALSQEGEGK
jgi:hypothetical protein